MIGKKILLTAVIIVIAGVIAHLELSKPDRNSSGNADIETTSNNEDKSLRYEPAKELVGVQEFINSDPFKIADYIGKKVILIDFWTYSCINCQRTTPYLNAWWEQYEDDGLLIVGVHTPEFEFEKKYDNVVKAAQSLGIKYPVVQDNNYSTWTAYGNRYWPRKYLVDIDGYVVYDHIGEGAYEETEEKIRALLEEKKLTLGETGTIAEEISKAEGAQEVSAGPRSPEIYFGAWRNELLANGKTFEQGIQELSEPDDAALNHLY